MALLEEVCHWGMGFEVSSPPPGGGGGGVAGGGGAGPWGGSGVGPGGGEVSSPPPSLSASNLPSATAPAPCLPTVLLPAGMVMGSPSETVKSLQRSGLGRGTSTQ